MDHEQNETPFLTQLFRRFCASFCAAIITITITGMILSSSDNPINVTSTLFSFGFGLMYGTILQLAAFSIIIAFFSVLLFEERFFSKLRFAVRTSIFMIVVLGTASLFVIVFKWFPLDDIFAWLTFASLTIICFAISFGLTMLKLKREREKYGKLLADFKARKKPNTPQRE
jgi:magnesium-transporting ATPase (P-type)